MKRIKHSIAAVLSIMILFGNLTVAVNAADSPKISIFCDNQMGNITGFVGTDSAEAKSILVYLIKDVPEGNGELIGVEELQIKDRIYPLSISFSKDVEEGWYLFTVEDYKAVEDKPAIPLAERQQKIYISTRAKAEEAISRINKAGKNDIGTILSQYANITGMDLLTDYTKDTDAIFLAMRDDAGATISKMSEINSLFSKAKATSALKNTKASLLGEKLVKYSPILNLDLSDDYKTYTSDVHLLLEQLMKTVATDHKAVANTQKAYQESVALAVLNNGTRETITKILEKYHNFFEITLNSDYYSKDVEVNKALERQNFQTVQSVKIAFDKRMKELFEFGEKQPSNNGGSSPNVNYVPPKPTEEPEKPTEEPIPQIDFTDLDSVPWAADEIRALAKANIISGYEGNEFMPQKNITREEFLKMLVCAFKLKNEEAIYSFTDGDAGAWYAPYVASAGMAGVVSGYEDGSFGVGKLITRQDMSVMAYRVAKLTAADEMGILFSDHDAISDYAKPAVYTLRQKNIISGMEDGSFAPTENATRAEAAKLLYSLLGGEFGA